jgi:hypothetical protein
MGVEFWRSSTGVGYAPSLAVSGWTFNPDGDLFLETPPQTPCDGQPHRIAVLGPLPAGPDLYIVNTQGSLYADGGQHLLLETALYRQRNGVSTQVDYASLDHSYFSYPMHQAAVQHQFKRLGHDAGAGPVVDMKAGDSLEMWGRCTYFEAPQPIPPRGMVPGCRDVNNNIVNCSAFFWVFGYSQTNPATVTVNPAPPGPVAQFGPKVEVCDQDHERFTYTWTAPRNRVGRIDFILNVPAGTTDEIYVLLKAVDGQIPVAISPEDYTGSGTSQGPGGTWTYVQNFAPDVLVLPAGQPLTAETGNWWCTEPAKSWRWRVLFR